MSKFLSAKDEILNQVEKLRKSIKKLSKFESLEKFFEIDWENECEDEREALLMLNSIYDCYFSYDFVQACINVGNDAEMLNVLMEDSKER